MNTTSAAAKITIKPRAREDKVKVKVTIAEMSGKALAAKKAYFIHSNGGRPYAVIVNELLVDVYENTYEDDGETYAYLGKISCDKVMIGHDAIEGEHGNSILLKQGENYIYIGGGEPGITSLLDNAQEIVDYQSPLGPNDVPYPYAVSKDYIYLMIENVRIPKADAVKYQDANNELWPYTAYYESDIASTPMETIVWDFFDN
jgi:hypothetical protein